ncbi:NfeD family protein [Neorhodopirellula pilleata]|nr:NfeD family protein [Neorhodopirellula pilleata]
MKRLPVPPVVLFLLASAWSGTWLEFACAQDSAEPAVAIEAEGATGHVIPIASPVSAREIEQVLAQLSRLAQAARQDRVTVVLRFAAESDSQSPTAETQPAAGTTLEDSLRLARAISGPDMKRIRTIAWIDSAVTGNEVLLVLACEAIVVSPQGSLGSVTSGGPPADETTALIYQSIAARRGLLPAPVVSALIDPDLELANVRMADGPTRFAIGDELEQLRVSGKVIEETIWSPPWEPLTLTADQLRQLRAATAIVSDENEVADRLGLSRLRDPVATRIENAVGVYVRINGTITRQRVRRWQTNLAATIEKGETNTWLIEVDSPGGDLVGSAALAAVMADPGSTIGAVGGFVAREARGDAALIALACRPLSIHPDATLGGSGADAMTAADVARQAELIRIVADATNRSETLIRGLLDRDLAVHRFVHRQTGRVRFAVPSEITAEYNDNPANEGTDVSSVWKREERIELSEGITASTAIELGLADGIAESLPIAAAAVGMTTVPPPLADRGLIRWVERMGRNDQLAFGLLLVGFMLLSTEASAPGFGLPGFLSMLCFAFFFWTKFLAGTAEWAELLAFGLGLVCLGIEIFVLPGFGVFGIGGLILTVLGVVLMSQTFVIPRNAYQASEAVGGVWMALGGMGGLVLGFIAVRAFLPKAATAAGLAMEVPSASLEDFERVANYDHLIGQTGVAATRLRPSGKARFGDEIVSVISDGSSVEAGQEVRVLQVLGNRIVVEAVEE